MAANGQILMEPPTENWTCDPLDWRESFSVGLAVL